VCVRRIVKNMEHDGTAGEGVNGAFAPAVSE
jgi:hypothetical protein